MKRTILVLTILSFLVVSNLNAIAIEIKPITEVVGANQGNEDPISHEPFIDLIKEKQDLGLPYIIAQVKTIAKGKETFHIYDAAAFNRYLFGRETPLALKKETLPTLLRVKMNPANRLPMQQISYFIRYPDKDYFEFAGSEQDFFSAKPTSLFFILMANFSGIDSARNTLAEAYFKAKDYEKSKFYFELAYRLNKALDWKGRAAYYLGTMYEEGLGVPQDDAKALKYLKEAVDLMPEIAGVENPFKVRLRALEERMERKFQKSW